MKCKNCKYFEENYQIQVIGINHPRYWEQCVYCTQIEKGALTEEDLNIECQLEDNYYE